MALHINEAVKKNVYFRINKDYLILLVSLATHESQKVFYVLFRKTTEERSVFEAVHYVI